jgi:phospholipid/cholesterol/gamma-HCH transport system substrate-binding protein
MADPKKTSWAQLRVGLVAIASMAIAAVLIFLLTGNAHLFEGSVRLKTYMEDSAGMAEGSAVRLNGILAGNIRKIQLSGSRDAKRTVEIQLDLRRKFLESIPEDSIAGISASNLLGDKYINITKGKSSKHVEADGELRSATVQDIPELVSQASTILTQFQSVASRVDALLKDIDAGKGNIGKLLKDEELYTRVNDTATQLDQLVKDVRNANGTISKLLYDDTLYNEIRKPVQRINDIVAQVQKGQGTAGKLLNDNALYDEANKTLVEVHQMIDGLQAGKGTAGKLFKDEELYRQLNLIAGKLNTTIEKLNAGQGTIGQLLVNPQLFDSLNFASREAQLLVKDMRANPKKFLRIKLALF